MAAIAKRYGVPLDDLVEANLGIRNPSLIYPGQKVTIPTGFKPAASKMSGEYLDPSSYSLASSRKPLPKVPAALEQLDQPNLKIPKGTIAGYGDVPVEGLTPGAKPTGPIASYGDSGPGVASLQNYLKNRGFDPGPIDGAWGPATQKAYDAYVKAKGQPDWATIAAKTPSSKPTSSTTIPTSTTGYRAPADAISYATKYGRAYGVDPKLLLAIARHETGFGTLGLGRRGLDLGYGAFDSGASYAWQGRENQYMYGAKWLAAHGVHSLQDLLAGKASSWATDPNWESGVAQAYQSI